MSRGQRSDKVGRIQITAAVARSHANPGLVYENLLPRFASIEGREKGRLLTDHREQETDGARLAGLESWNLMALGPGPQHDLQR